MAQPHEAHDRDDLEARLAAAYDAGCAARRSALPDEPPDRDLVSLGARLRRQTLARYRGRYADSGLRLFLCMPRDPRTSPWYGDLLACLAHVGIVWAWAPCGDPALATKLEVFRPTVVISTDSLAVLESRQPEVISAYKRAHGCLRLNALRTPHRDKTGELSAPDRARLQRTRAGELGDALFSVFVADHFRAVCPEWRQAGIPYLEWCSGFNPLIHWPQARPRDLDFFMVAGYEPDRVQVAADYLEPIFRRHFGLWAGPRWRFGAGPLDPPRTRAFYARARIAINPLHRAIVAKAMDISQRTFAAAACGTFVLTDQTPVTERFFAADEIVATTGPREFQEAFEHFVARPAERSSYARRALLRVFAQHTYFHRIHDLLAFVAEHGDRA
jgi:hypothetical protein